MCVFRWPSCLLGLPLGVSTLVALQGALQFEAHLALVAPVRLLVSVVTHVDDHFGIVGKNLATQDIGPAPPRCGPQTASSGPPLLTW